MKTHKAREAETPDWDALVAILESWREMLAPDNKTTLEIVGTEPSVTTIAEQYHRDAWAVLVSTILSLRTKDEVTMLASRRVLAKAPNPAALLEVSEEELAALAYPAGFYKTKAATLRKIAVILIQEHHGRVPADMDALLALPGVGRKTANLVLIEAFDMDGICVDVHVHRISNRLGILGPQGSRDPGETEAILRRILPRKYWKRINSLLVLYGQRICRPISPFCSRCAISPFCGHHGVGKTR
ncbi:MAG: endonuclease III [Treponema sp.]|jgi:endonuclease-3|nr:endonuclease III [Treponema sp.]